MKEVNTVQLPEEKVWKVRYVTSHMIQGFTFIPSRFGARGAEQTFNADNPRSCVTTITEATQKELAEYG